MRKNILFLSTLVLCLNFFNSYTQTKFSNVNIQVISDGPLGELNGSLIKEIKDLGIPFTFTIGSETRGVVPILKLMRYDLNSKAFIVLKYEPDFADKFFASLFNITPPYTKQKNGLSKILSEHVCKSNLANPNLNNICIPSSYSIESDKRHVIKFSRNVVYDVHDYIVNCRKNNISIGDIVIIHEQLVRKKIIFRDCGCNRKEVLISYVLQSGEFNTLQECRKQNTKTVFVFNSKTCTCEAKPVSNCAKLGPGEYLTRDECIKANYKTIYVCNGEKCISKQVCKSAELLPGQYLNKDECIKHCNPLKLTLAFNGAQIFRWTVSGDAKKIAKYTVSVDYAQGYSKQTCIACGVAGITWDITNPQENSARITNVENADHPGMSESNYRWDVTVYAKDSKGNILASDTKRSVKILCNHGGKK